MGTDVIDVAADDPHATGPAPLGSGSAPRTGSVRLAGVTARFGYVTAVDDVTLDVHPGELLVLLGPSGCGKTTLLRMIAGLDQPTAGSVSIDGRCVDHVDPKDRDVAMVFQSYALYPHLTVAGNIAFPLRKRGIPRRQHAALVREAAALVGLDRLLDRKPRTLSGGQRQRVALARAIVRRPAVFLMDEPLSNLDAPMRAGARALLTELHSRLGITIVYVTHDQVEAMTMATRLVVMDAGCLQQSGAPDDVYGAPANTFVARFLGSPGMNLLRGRVRDDEMSVAVGAAVLPLMTPADIAGEVIVGVRPEHLRVGDEGIGVDVRAVESHGHERVVRAATPDGDDVLFRAPADDVAPEPGERLRVAAPPGAVHLFDAATGMRRSR
jgi:ABC-type sugar transport system ATPase subunit